LALMGSQNRASPKKEYPLSAWHDVILPHHSHCLNTLAKLEKKRGSFFPIKITKQVSSTHGSFTHSRRAKLMRHSAINRTKNGWKTI
jgi:hypothetical protein